MPQTNAIMWDCSVNLGTARDLQDCLGEIDLATASRNEATGSGWP